MINVENENCLLNVKSYDQCWIVQFSVNTACQLLVKTIRILFPINLLVAINKTR